jgi:hypothetical protein
MRLTNDFGVLEQQITNGIKCFTSGIRFDNRKIVALENGGEEGYFAPVR